MTLLPILGGSLMTYFFSIELELHIEKLPLRQQREEATDTLSVGKKLKEPLNLNFPNYLHAYKADRTC